MKKRKPSATRGNRMIPSFYDGQCVPGRPFIIAAISLYWVMSTLEQRLLLAAILSCGEFCAVWSTRAIPTTSRPWCARSTWLLSNCVLPTCSHGHRRDSKCSHDQKLHPFGEGRSLLRRGSMAADHAGRAGAEVVLQGVDAC